jgi:diguanylate cyclase (GGDEF)-like protein
MQGKTDPDAGRGGARLSSQYMFFGIFAGLLAPGAVMLHALIAERTAEPYRLFAMLAVGGATVFAVLGRIIGRRDEALIARNHDLAVLSAAFEALSATDGLTGISNRRTFDDRLKMEVGRSNRYGVPCALVMIDLDHFKTLNDRFGHQAGDQILRRTAALLDAEKRSGDLVARYGGEEFVAILPNVDSQGAWVWAERVRERLAAERVPWEDHQVSITASFGIADTPGHGHSVAVLIEAADHALYEAKNRGRNHAVVAVEGDLASSNGPKKAARGS